MHAIRGRYGFTPQFPTVPGIESVGVIDELGSGADGLTVGQRFITIGVTGTWQDYVVADAGRVLPVSAGMSDSTAAQILSNPLTAVILTGEVLDVRPGEWLLQTAAGSIVGQSVIQLGAHVGFKTLNVVRRRSAVEDILALGGTAVICTEDEDLRERVADIAGHDGVSKAIDCVSGQVGADVSRALAPHGELVVYGALSTHSQSDPDHPHLRALLDLRNKDRSGVLAVPLVHREPEGSDGRSDRPDSSARLQRRVARAEGQPIPVESSAKPSIWPKLPHTGANRCWCSNRSR
jgi:NADPH:quinone reductase-like Zn-dependent oxidoreductase